MQKTVLAGSLLAASFAITACEPASDPPQQAEISEPAAAAKASEPSSVEPQPVPAAKLQISSDMSLTEAWRTEGFSKPASVLARADGSYLVSNIAGDPRETDGTGWIALVSPDGEMLDGEFVTGLDAPGGMEIDRGVLYVADIDQVHLINPADGTRHRSIKVDGAEGLTGVTAWDAGLFLADGPSGRIYQLSGDEIDLVFEDDQLIGIKQIVPSDDGLLAAVPDRGVILNISAGGTISELVNGIPGANAIAPLDNGYLVSAAPGQLWFLSDTGEAREILNTQAEGIMQNGLTVTDETVLVANEVPGTLTAWLIRKD